MKHDCVHTNCVLEHNCDSEYGPDDVSPEHFVRRTKEYEQGY